MNKLLLGCFYSIALSLAGNFSPAPELVKRARGYDFKQAQSKIRYEDGIDRAEAFAYAEQEILGEINYKRLPVQRYDRPIKDGELWRINVFIKTSKGLKNQPILVDSITSERYGEGVYDEHSWSSILGGEVDLGLSKYRMKRDRIANSLTVEVTLNRMTRSNDLTARQECYREAVRAIAKIKQNFPGKFEDALLTEIEISESELDDTYGAPDRMWQAKFRLWYAIFPTIQKRSVR
jgi:hypothetical protein